MDQVEVEILGQVITPQYGTLNTGDVLRTTTEFAKHLVEDCGAAKYRVAKSAPALPTVSPRPAEAAARVPKAARGSAPKSKK